MPRVPVVTGNSVRLAPRPVAAVQPVQLDNAIAEGVQHFGAQLGATAETVAQIAENRARLDAKAADVDYSAFGSDALYDPENGFMNLGGKNALDAYQPRSEENTSELQSLMRISYAVFCLKKQIQNRSHIH